MGALDVSSEHRLRSENLAFDIDVWYPPLAGHTFPTTFLPLSCAEARAIVAHNDVSWRAARPALTVAEVATLNTLEQRIGAALTAQFGERGAFLRLCGRSPKDGEPTDARRRADVWTSYEKELQRLVQEQGQPLDGNTRLAAVAGTQPWLRVRTGADAMSLLLTSERVFADMRDWLDHGEPEQIVLREWSDGFIMASEFRCYVEKGQLLAISQYDTYVMYHELQAAETHEMIASAIVAEWDKVRSCIETTDGSYCVDFGVDLATGKAQLIELSPFRTCTGPALFSWRKGAESASLERDSRYTFEGDVRGISPVGVADIPLKHQRDRQCAAIAKGAVLRVRSSPIAGIEDLVEANWDRRWCNPAEAVVPYRNHYEKTAVPSAEQKELWWMGWWRWMVAACGPSAGQVPAKPSVLMFVYGTLKRDCHWHSKYLSRARFICEVTTTHSQRLVLGDCGVPYLLRPGPDSGCKQLKCVRGELFAVDAETLQGIDEYEGVTKGHYARHQIPVTLPSCAVSEFQAQCYFYSATPGSSAGPGKIDSRLLEAECLSEYSVADQQRLYKPIRHIQVKQLLYLRDDGGTSTDAAMT